MQCPRCSHENPPGARFCNACGTNLEAGTAPTSPAADTSQVDFLQRYIPQALADKMRQLGGQVESERRHVTVVFADISGFTAMSEKLDPEEVTHIINACFKTLVEVIFKYEGTIDKFIGDEIMALFGAPIAHENDPERAIRAALEMQARLREFNANLKTPLPKPLTMHVGINSGEVIAGNVGSDLRMDYSVLGDTVNLAARLESVSVSGQILVSERTHALTRHLFEFKKLKPFKVQGKQKKVQTYEVASLKAVPERGRGVQAGYGPLVGRQEELAQLRQVAEQVRQGQGQVVGLVGDAGIGKSRLVYELQQLVPEFTQVSGACVSYEVPASYQVFTDVLGSLLSLAPDDDEFVQRRKLEAWAIARDLDEEHLPFLGSLFGLRDERLVYLQDEERYQQVQDTVLEVLRILSSPKPLLLVLEDLHWIDTPSRRLLEGLVAGVGALPVLICGAYRPEFQPAWSEHPACQILPVGPLPASQTSQLAQGLLKLQLPPELEHLLVERTEGNPFFVEELLKALIDEGVIARTRTGFELKKDVRTVQLPDTIHGVILARLDRLEAQTRDTLQYASVIGRRFSQALLQAVSPRAQHIEEDLQQLQGLDLVYQHSILPDLEFIFKHFVTREVAYNNVLGKRRKAIHLEVARSIEKIYKDRLEDYYEALAHHFEAGEDWQKAAEYYKQAGSKARELHADEGADVFLSRQRQAIRKLYEQEEGGRRVTTRWVGIGLLGLVSGLYVVLVLVPRSDGFLVSALGLMALASSIIMFLGATSFVGKVSHITVYSDHIVISAKRRTITIPFEHISKIQWLRSWASTGSWKTELTPSEMKKSIQGARNNFVGSLEGSRVSEPSSILFSLRDDSHVYLLSQNSGSLYRELKVVVSRWANTTGTDVTEMFASTAWALEQQYRISLRKRDDSSVRSINYTELLAEIEKATVNEFDEIRGDGILGSPLTFGNSKGKAHPTGYAIKEHLVNEEEHWITLKEVSVQDKGLKRALYPILSGLRNGYRGGFSIIVPLSSMPFLWLLISPWHALLAGPVVYAAFVLWSVAKGVLSWSKRLPRRLRALVRIAVPVAYICIVPTLLVLSSILAHVLKETGPQTKKTPPGARPKAYASPVTGIRIDGHLDEWPAVLPRYQVRTNGNSYGPTDLDSTELSTSADLSPRFVVGYDPENQLLYLGVQVRDDTLVLGSTFTETDACEVYVDGNPAEDESSLWEQFNPRSPGPALQYLAIPGDGSYGLDHDGKPSLRGRDIKGTKTQMAYSRQGDITTYEWAIQVFDHFPESPTLLTPGQTVGLDVVVVDKDGDDDNAAWICWGPPGQSKFRNTETLGELVLVEKTEETPANAVTSP